MRAADFECDRRFSWPRQLSQLIKWNVIIMKREPAFVVNDVLGTVLFLVVLVMLNIGLTVFPGTFSINTLPTLASQCPDSSNCIALGYVLPNSSIPQAASQSILNELATLIVESEPQFTTSNALMSFTSGDAMTLYRKQNPSRLFIGIEFDSLDATTFDCSYYIWILDTVFRSDYSIAGYTTAQAYMDRSIINAQRAAATQAGTPYPKLHSPLKYTENNGVRIAKVTVQSQSAGVWVVFYMILMFQTVTANASRAIANDKLLLRPGMVVMGMNETVYIISIMLVQIFTSVPVMLVVAAILCTFGKVFIYTSPVLICVLLVLYAILCSIFGYFLSVIFPDPRASTGMSFIALYVGLGMYAIGKISLFDKDAIPIAVQTLWLLSPHACFGRILDLISSQETILQSVSFSNLGSYPKIQTAFGMLGVDIFVWFILSWVLEKVRPGKGRIGLPITFLFDKNFWVPESIDESALGGDLDDLAPPPVASVSGDVEEVDFSAVDEKERYAVRISQVVKKFPAEKKKGKGPFAWLAKRRQKKTDANEDTEKVETEVVALNNVSLDLHSGQTLALLGHNGSGKTTLLSVLNGDLPPTSGKTIVRVKTNTPRGYSFLDTSNPTELSLIRRCLGVCPQFDVLFPSFTCKEHLILYSSLKGVLIKSTNNDADQSSLLNEYIDSLLKDVDLFHKANVRTAALSGGQKRKLSLAIALLGNPSLILLDEPTSGMDVGATEKVWRLIQEIKGDRTIIITTHSMEEADTLGDRVAILNKGEFQAIGTSMFLKGRFGVGYQMKVDLKESGSCTQVFEIVKQTFPNAELVAVSHTTGAITLVKPVGAGSVEYSGLLTSLFSKLNGLLDRGELKDVSAIGLGQTTLEQVFLALNDKE
ncbi:UNVERIFIED_CONTAM: ATP-binding cassette sub- A member 5 [Siphonaria sp. JEL0065]|nr:ATP-binding cassette sub- A member 5 [Siphonaria sp. JEL0065]